MDYGPHRDIHNPPCLLQQAVLPTPAKVEWTMVGKTLPTRQMDCKNAELLTSSTQLTQFNWLNNKPVAIVQSEILGIDHEYHGTEAPGMMYSSVFVRELMEG